MIIARINPARVEDVFIEAESDLIEDVLLAVWPLVRQHLGALDRDLRRVTGEVLGEKGQDESP